MRTMAQAMAQAHIKAIASLLTNKEALTAIEQVKHMLDTKQPLCNASFALLMKAGEITTNSYGYCHFAVNGCHYDLWTLCERLMQRYRKNIDPVLHAIYSELYERDYYGSSDDDE